VGEEPEETDSVRWVVPKEPGLVRVDWFELLLIPHEVLRWCREILIFPCRDTDASSKVPTAQRRNRSGL
jgi:hypothetical protein